jgi:importin subunit beta-1
MQVIIQKLGASDTTKLGIVQYGDQMMSLFLRVFACRSATVHEEAMLAIGALAYSTGPEFGKYMPEFYRYLEMGLQNFEEYQVCSKDSYWRPSCMLKVLYIVMCYVIFPTLDFLSFVF